MNSNPKYNYRYFTYIQPVLRSPVVKTYGSIIFTIFALIIFTFFAIKPTIETVLVLQKKLDNSKEIYAKVTEKTENLTKARQNYNDLESSTKSKIQIAVPSNPEIKTIIQTLEAIALINQASISAIQIQPIVLETKGRSTIENKELGEVLYTINLEGSYRNLTNFIKQLHQTNRLMTIESLTINKSQTGQSILLSINGKSYYLK